MKRNIPVAGPWITQLEIDCVTDAVTNAWYEKANMYHEKLESAFAARLGVRHTMALPSCTSGIHLILAALGIGAGDEVIVPEITWIATAAPISYVGATPVFVDIDPVTWCICPDSVEAAITPTTKAIIAVDLYGNVADYGRLREISEKHGLYLIEDSAEAAGATYQGREAGSFGIASVFSFHGSKTLTSGEGGLMATDDTKLYERAQFLRDHGRPPGDTAFQNTEVAYKYKMSSMQAALAFAQLTRLDDLIKKKREAFSWYSERLRGIEGIQLNSPGEDVEASYWMASIVWNETYLFDKKTLAGSLRERFVDTRPFFSALSSIPAYAGARKASLKFDNPHAMRISEHGINLPSSLSITESEVDYVCSQLKQCLDPNRAK